MTSRAKGAESALNAKRHSNERPPSQGKLVSDKYLQRRSAILNDSSHELVSNNTLSAGLPFERYRRGTGFK